MMAPMASTATAERGIAGAASTMAARHRDGMDEKPRSKVAPRTRRAPLPADTSATTKMRTAKGSGPAIGQAASAIGSETRRRTEMRSFRLRDSQGVPPPVLASEATVLILAWLASADRLLAKGRRSGVRVRGSARSPPRAVRGRNRANRRRGTRTRYRPHCHSRKFDMRISPLVRMSRSGSGMPAVSSAAAQRLGVMSAGVERAGERPVRPARRAALAISAREP